jgi:hypothetical protein
MKMKLEIIGVFVLLIVLVGLSGNVDAKETQFLCLGKGEKVKFSECNPVIRDRTCAYNSCQYCVTKLDSGAYCPTSLNKCNGAGLSCSFLSGGGDDGGIGDLDTAGPELALESPVEGEVYTNKRILVDLDMNENGAVYYIDNNNNRGRWTKVCSNCYSYSRPRSFREGFNDVTFRAIDPLGNEEFVEIDFFVDSKKPSISSPEPRRGKFASGKFSVKFKEENPESLVLNYGNLRTGYGAYSLDLGEECVLDRGKQLCSANVNLEEYDGEEVEYWFEIRDIAGNSKATRNTNVNVDIRKPEILEFGYEIDRRRVEFRIEIDEENLKDVTYIDYSDSRPRLRKLCSSRLRDEVCIKKTGNLREGFHEIDVFVNDKAGNSVKRSLSLEI